MLRAMLLEHLFQLDQFELLGRELYHSGKWDRLFQPRTLDEFLQFKRCGSLPDSPVLEEIYRLIESPVSSENAYMATISDIVISVSPRYNLGIIHSHDYFEMSYLMNGHCTQLIGESHIEMSEGDFIILTPGVPHFIQSFQDDAIVILVAVRKSTFRQVFFGLLKNQNVLSDYFNRIFSGTGSAAFFKFQTGNDSYVLDQFLDLYFESNHSDMFSDTYLNASMTELFIYLLRFHQKNALAGSELLQSKVSFMPILQYIQQHYADNLSLQSLAAHFHYHPSHLSRLIQENTGVSFSTLRQQLKIQRACELLQTSLSIHEIADQLGYSDVSHFYKSFSKAKNCTPVQYRTRQA